LRGPPGGPVIAEPEGLPALAVTLKATQEGHPGAGSFDLALRGERASVCRSKFEPLGELLFGAKVF
jgi:hypothetical protein